MAAEPGSLIFGAKPGTNFFALLKPLLETSPAAQGVVGHCRAVLEGDSDGFAVEYEGGAASNRRVYGLQGFRVPVGSPAHLLLAQEDVTAARAPVSLPQGTAPVDPGPARPGGELVAWVSHELKSPLTAIVSFSEILGHNRERTLTAKQLDYVRIIQRNAHRLHVLVDDLHDLSKLESGNFALKRTIFDAGLLLNEIAQNMQPVLAGRRQQLSLARPSGLMIIEADRGRLTQVLTNILDNASKYSPHGSEIKAGAEFRDGWLRIAVADQGEGIPAEALARIFEPFYRVDTDATRSVQGSGLGLTIVKRLVELQGGKVEVESELGRGTVVQVTLPAKTR